jgi:hypothetical protein
LSFSSSSSSSSFPFSFSFFFSFPFSFGFELESNDELDDENEERGSTVREIFIFQHKTGSIEGVGLDDDVELKNEEKVGLDEEVAKDVAVGLVDGK